MCNAWGRIRIGIKMESRILIRIDIRAQMCKLLRSPGINSTSLCTLVVVPARQATSIGLRNGFVGSLKVFKRLQIRALNDTDPHNTDIHTQKHAYKFITT
jgi:hypothetical protein